MTAAIWRNDFGLELRVENNGKLVESRLSRVGEAPLVLIADQVKANLIEKGWTETQNATWSGYEPQGNGRPNGYNDLKRRSIRAPSTATSP